MSGTGAIAETISVVPMRMAHLEGVLELGFRAFDVSTMPYTSWSLSSITEHFDTQPEACWVAEAEGEVLGFVLGSMSYDEREDWGYMEWIALDPRARGSGVASHLVEACCQALFDAGAARIITDVEHGNEPSARMMRRNSFIEGVTVTLFVRKRSDEPGRQGRMPHVRSKPEDPARARVRSVARRSTGGGRSGE
ncbi:GNAT family N-acetyltransferase [Actinopolyspora mortivallis]|uniref:GNAT family N-acetyltransferase n=1 Tax=Actinopolyspora mortivallis TaxID=33906 RepID=A0A2T0GT67_ACTMO|nr:GNAT family N-acetyltransferase [Actinopolyspora mortivallis]PRW62233.1 GNAT family N-acetyltransferase [Actinopolyspora mortivallis]